MSEFYRLETIWSILTLSPDLLLSKCGKRKCEGSQDSYTLHLPSEDSFPPKNIIPSSFLYSKLFTLVVSARRSVHTNSSSHIVNVCPRKSIMPRILESAHQRSGVFECSSHWFDQSPLCSEPDKVREGTFRRPDVPLFWEDSGRYLWPFLTLPKISHSHSPRSLSMQLLCWTS